jgi:MOSC domain-containing protein YiiM
MDEQCPGLTAALGPDWGGGAYGVVLNSGDVLVGDAVSLEPPAAT